MSEVEIDKELTGRRAAKPGFVECSFPTIAGALPPRSAKPCAGPSLAGSAPGMGWIAGTSALPGIALSAHAETAQCCGCAAVSCVDAITSPADVKAAPAPTSCLARAAGVDGNGAIIHYRAAEDTCSTADSGSMLLLDSGAQYDCGTTDITRTVHFGTPSDHQKRCFTAVLKGHIALDSCAPLLVPPHLDSIQCMLLTALIASVYT